MACVLLAQLRWNSHRLRGARNTRDRPGWDNGTREGSLFEQGSSSIRTRIVVRHSVNFAKETNKSEALIGPSVAALGIRTKRLAHDYAALRTHTYGSHHGSRPIWLQRQARIRVGWHAQRLRRAWVVVVGPGTAHYFSRVDASSIPHPSLRFGSATHQRLSRTGFRQQHDHALSERFRVPFQCR